MEYALTLSNAAEELLAARESELETAEQRIYEAAT